MARHWFFFSYARDNQHRLLNKFFTDLWGLLSGPLNSTEQEETPFRDTASVRVGSKWLDGLREALEWSRTMIPVVSPAYLSSDWCGKELAYFEKLSKHQYPGRSERILPVIWSDVGLASGRSLPAPLNAYQYARNLPDVYSELGLFGIMTGEPRIRRLYSSCVSIIARDLVYQGRLYPASGGAPGVTLENTPSAFQSSASVRAKVVYLATKDGWRPYVPPELIDPVQTVIARKQIGSEELPLGPDFLQSVTDSAGKGNPVLIVLEPNAAGMAARIAPLLDLNRAAHRTVALFVAWNEQDPEVRDNRQAWQDTIDRQITPRVALVNPPIRSPEQLQREVRRAIDLIQAQVTTEYIAGRTSTGGEFPRI